MERLEKNIIKYVRGSIEAYLDNKRTLNWIKGIIKKSGILECQGLLREILDGLQHLRETLRYRQLLKECLKEGWMELKTGVVLDIINWEEWESLLEKAKAPNFQERNGCMEFYINPVRNFGLKKSKNGISNGINNKDENSPKYVGLAYPDRRLSSEKEAVILAEIDTHHAQDGLYREWRQRRITYQDYRISEEEISKGHTPILDWIKRKYKELKNS